MKSVIFNLGVLILFWRTCPYRWTSFAVPSCPGLPTGPVIINNKRPTHIIIIFYVHYVLRWLCVVITSKLFNERVPPFSSGCVYSKCLKMEESSDTFIVDTVVAAAVRFFRTHVARGPHVSRAAFDFFLRCCSFYLHTAGWPPGNIQRLAGNRILKFTIFHFVTVVTFTSFACYDIFVFKAPGNTRHELWRDTPE